MTSTPTNNLIFDYIRTGIIQFGKFQQSDGSLGPVACHFTLLPSFPKLMSTTAEALVSHFPMQTERDRFLTTRNTIALGGVLATLTNMPMLFPHGDVLNFTAAFSIEGTADVGNPTTLLTDVLTDGQIEAEMMVRSRRIGVPIHKIVSILDLRRNSAFHLPDNMVIETLFSLADYLDELVSADFLTPHMAKAIHKWLHPPLSFPPQK